MNLRIDYLKHHPHAINTLAKIWQDELGKIWCPEVTLKQVQLKFEQHLHIKHLPIGKIAFDEDKPIGMSCLRGTEGIREELTPWLGGLVVSKAYQGKGIGKLLIYSVKSDAKNLGFNSIYLLTFDSTLPNYYKQLGWVEIEKNHLNEKPVTIMKTAI